MKARNKKMEQIMLDVAEEVTTKETPKAKETKAKATKKNDTKKAEPKEVTPKEDKAKEKEEAKKKALEEKEKAKEEKAKAKLVIDELREKLVMEITTKNKDLKENVTIKNTTKYVGVRYKGKVIAELEQVGRGLICRVLDIYGEDFPTLENDYNTKEGENDLLIKKCPSRFGWRTNTELLLQNKKQYTQCFNALKLSIDVVKKEEEDKKKKKEESKKVKES